MLEHHFALSHTGNARRGKRLRPQLLLRIAQAEGAPRQAALDAAVAVEILHNYSLVHDDIEDGDRLRHGRPSLWAKYGIAQAINTGDALCALSYLTLLSLGRYHDSGDLVQMTRVLHAANLRMCEGQSLDLGFESASSVSMDDYLTMIQAKTASLFSAACEIGALCAHCSGERAKQYAAIGDAFGIAFQIRDDVLGTWGNAALTGKEIGVDIARRKWTFPVVWALGQSSSKSRDVIERAYAQSGAIQAQAVPTVIAALDEVGAREAAELRYGDELSRAEQLASIAGSPNLTEGLLST